MRKKRWEAVMLLQILSVSITVVPLVGCTTAGENRIVVLTFDDALKSHRTVVAPLLKELGFGATFFVTHRRLDDPENFLSWAEIGEIHRMGFEIGNHSWTHADFSIPKNAGRLASELALVDFELLKVRVPRPVSFAYSDNQFGPEAVQGLIKRNYKFARRGEEPELSLEGQGQCCCQCGPRTGPPSGSNAHRSDRVLPPSFQGTQRPILRTVVSPCHVLGVWGIGHSASLCDARTTSRPNKASAKALVSLCHMLLASNEFLYVE